MNQKSKNQKLEKMFQKTAISELPGIEVNVLKPDSRKDYFRAIHIVAQKPKCIHHDPKIKLRLV